MSTTQIAAIRRALVAQEQGEKHSIDLRFRVPLYFRQYYFVLVGGRDRRRSTLTAEIGRLNRYPKSIRRAVFFTASGVLLLASFVAIFVLLYLAKSFIGIDIFDNFHLSDLLPFDLYGMAKEFFEEW